MSSLLRALKHQQTAKSKTSSHSAPSNTKQSHCQTRPYVMQTNYSSVPVQLPPDFLKVRADREPIQAKQINFATTTLPEYAPYYATVLDNVLSASECAELLELAELSSPTGNWAPALINVGPGFEVLETDIRHCDRIIWDEQSVVDRIWERCLLADGISEQLGQIGKQPGLQDKRAAELGSKWRMVRANERMRFLRYGPGNYFKSHYDGTYTTPSGDQRSFYTLHLYLNDSVAYGGNLKGGATTFHSRDMTRRLDVDPKMGRVLIFQHAHLLHSGDEVQEGIKYTMRSDLMYEQIVDEDSDNDGMVTDG